VEVKNKLYELEVTPPPGVWQRIAEELDDADQGRNYPAKLYGLEAAAPAAVWPKIEAALDSAIPAGTVAFKLAALAVDPPAGAWQKISATINAEEETIPERRKLSPFLRYAAAAILIGLLAWGGISLLNNNKQGEDKIAVAGQPSAQPGNSHSSDTVSETAIASNTNTTPDTEAAAEEARNDAALEASKKTFAKLDISPVSKIKAAADFYFADPVATVNGRGIHIGDDNDVPQYTPTPDSEPSRYIMLLTPEGNIIRMSKKLSNMVCCVSGEEQDKDCKDQMQKWREKLACSPATHSPGNFMDILSLAHALQQDNQ
jgi:hypothetical protein